MCLNPHHGKLRPPLPALRALTRNLSVIILPYCGEDGVSSSVITGGGGVGGEDLKVGGLFVA